MQKVLLYYKYVEVKNPQQEVKTQKEFCLQQNLLGRVLIGYEGINGTLAGEENDIEKYKKYLNTHSIFQGIVFKETPSQENPFKKLKIKFRPEIVTLGKKVDLENAAPKLEPKELHEQLENGEDMVLIDMRNNYESAIGRFSGAIESGTDHFRDLPEKLEYLKKYKDKKVVTYCTGGIRCEKASALLVENGFKNVYQLSGGIFKYAENYPDGFFEGKCFVFDERMDVDFAKSNSKTLTNCEHCSRPADHYYDCANNSCHRLYISCENCLKKSKNLCSQNHETLVPATASF